MPAATSWQRRKDRAGIVAMIAVVALMLYLALAPDQQTIRITPPTAPVQADALRTVISRPTLPVVLDTGDGIDDLLAVAMLRTYEARRDVKLVSVAEPGQVRRALAGQADRSVVIIATGPATNLAQLLESAPDATSPLSGRELVKTKVKLLAMTAGDFLRGKPDDNTARDAASARLVFSTWPTPIVAGEWQIGANLPFPGDAVTDGSLVAAMTAYGHDVLGVPFPYNPPGGDLATTLYGVEPDRYLKVGEPGRITLDEHNVARFTPDPQGQHRLILRPVDPEAVTRRFAELVQSPTAEAG